jgi:hypothetical protein
MIPGEGVCDQILIGYRARVVVIDVVWLVEAWGFEPQTPTLQRSCSTN